MTKSILLRLSKETNAKRVESRHGGIGKDPEKMKTLVDTLNGLYDAYEARYSTGGRKLHYRSY